MGHVFRHPKYYEELRRKREEAKRAQSSKPQASGTKQQAIEETVPHNDIEESLKD